ncbi:MAG TPA: glycosyltransferase 87 family protein [Thermoleophilaceae bacterium]
MRVRSRGAAVGLAAIACLSLPAAGHAAKPLGPAARHVRALAAAAPGVKRFLHSHPGARARAPYWDRNRWRVDYSLHGHVELEVVLDRGYRMLGVWKGLQARAEFTRGGFGELFDSPWLIVGFGVLFMAPFVDPRRPVRLLHLDLLVLLSFGVSYWFLRDGVLRPAIVLVYPVLVYLLARMLWAGMRARRRDGRLVPYAPTRLLVIGLLLIAGARVGLNLATHKTFDISYASVVGADRVWHKEPLYVQSGSHLDTYGPLAYAAYVPFELVFPWHESWDRLPAAHAAAIVFDLLTIAGLVLLGRRLRAGPEGTRLGVALAWGWAAFPFTLLGLMLSTNDGLVAMLVVWTFVAFASPTARGALLAAAAAAKFFPGALLPALAAGRGDRDRGRAGVCALAFAAIFAFAIAVYMPPGGPRAVWNSTLGWQLAREPDFSLWAIQSGIGWTKTLLEGLAIGLAVLVAVRPGRRSLVQVAALAAAVTIALQLPAGHWFYFYIVWFAPLVLAALFGEYGAEERLAAHGVQEQVHLVGTAAAREEDELVRA